MVGGVMTETEFWRLIDQSRDAVGGDLESMDLRWSGCLRVGRAPCED